VNLEQAIQMMKTVIGTRVTGTGVELAQIQQAFDVILASLETKNGNDAIPVQRPVEPSQ
jgi:hypothetical protein